MDDTLFAHIISNVGIPAALCFYTLFEVNKNVKKLADSIDRFNDDIDKRVNKIETDLRELTVEVKAFIRRQQQ